MNTASKLKLTLLTNGSFSLISGIICILYSNQLSEIFQLNSSVVFTIIGLGLIPFAALVFYSASTKKTNRKVIASIIVQDFIWVIGSIVIVAFQLFSISSIGNLIIGSVAFVILIFAILQFYFLSKQ